MRSVSSDARESTVEECNRIFDVLAHPYRRTIIDELTDGDAATVDELAARIADRHRSASVRSARRALVHGHLPRLAAADVVAYDPAAERCELDDAVAVRAVLTAARERV